MPLIYRVMTVETGKPLVANTARGLGVRFDGPNADIRVDENGNVHPGKQGMSVAPAWRELPIHRIPIRLKPILPKAAGKDQDACWKMGTGPFVESLVADGLMRFVEHAKHGLVGPTAIVAKELYSQALAATRDFWVIDEV